MWDKVGYSPQDIEIASLYDDLGEEDAVANLPPAEQIGGRFTPPKPQSHPNMLGGVMGKNIPQERDVGAIFEFLMENVKL